MTKTILCLKQTHRNLAFSKSVILTKGRPYWGGKRDLQDQHRALSLENPRDNAQRKQSDMKNSYWCKICKYSDSIM